MTGRLFDVEYVEVDRRAALARGRRRRTTCSGTATRLGRIQLDLHPRAGKYGHAAQFDLAPGIAGRQLAEGVLVCNFSRDLMEHDHVVTLFHEFGHLLHHVLAGGHAWTRFSGVATEWDFVEAPSQMLEEWAWDADVLRSFATDADGEPIPRELVAKMRAAKDFGTGCYARTQMFYAALSYTLHRIAEVPFDSEYKFMATFHEMIGDGGAAGGALLRQRCAGRAHRPGRRTANPDGTLVPVTDDNRHLALDANDRMAESGERVMVVAQRDFDPSDVRGGSAT